VLDISDPLQNLQQSKYNQPVLLIFRHLIHAWEKCRAGAANSFDDKWRQCSISARRQAGFNVYF
jgi:hypothetical protein